MFRNKLLTLFRHLAFFLPINALRILFLRLGGVAIGEKVKVGIRCSFMEEVTLKNGAVIASGVTLGRGTRLGKGVLVESRCKLYMASVLDGTLVQSGSLIVGSEKNIVKIGENCVVGYYSVLDGSGGLEIGNNVHIASPSTGVWSHSSVENCLDGNIIDSILYEQNKVFAGVKIGSNTWLGGNSSVMPGIQIGSKTLVMPNSVVNRNLEGGKMYGGVPVQEIGYKRYVSWR